MREPALEIRRTRFLKSRIVGEIESHQWRGRRRSPCSGGRRRRRRRVEIKTRARRNRIRHVSERRELVEQNGGVVWGGGVLEPGGEVVDELEIHGGGDALEESQPAAVIGVAGVAGEPRGGLDLLVLAATAADGDVAQGAAARPVAPARLAEVARLREAVVVVVAEFCVGGVAAGALEGRFLVPGSGGGFRGRLRRRWLGGFR